MPSRFLRLARLLQSAPEAEVRVVVHGRTFHDGGELLARVGVAAGVEVGATQGFPDRCLVGLVGAGLLERDRRRGEVAALEQVAAAAEEVVHVLAPLLGGALVPTHAGLTSSDSVGPPARSASTWSRIARATCSLGARSTSWSPALVTIVTSLSLASNPMPCCEMSFTTTASRRLRVSFCRARSTPPSPCSAANPTSTWPGRRFCDSVASTSLVGASSSESPSRPSFLILSSSSSAGRKSATAA